MRRGHRRAVLTCKDTAVHLYWNWQEEAARACVTGGPAFECDETTKEDYRGDCKLWKEGQVPKCDPSFSFFLSRDDKLTDFDAHTTNRFRCTLWYDPSKALRQKALLIMATINTSQKTLITVDVAFFNAWFAVVVRLVKTVAWDAPRFFYGDSHARWHPWSCTKRYHLRKAHLTASMSRSIETCRSRCISLAAMPRCLYVRTCTGEMTLVLETWTSRE
jgi:hypothetical protein